MIRFFVKLLLAVLIATNSSSLISEEADSKTREEMSQHLLGIKNIFDAQYAPTTWKMSYSEWDLNKVAEDAINKIKTANLLTTKDYQKILREFLFSTKDYHVNLIFYSTESAFLPFQIKGVDGRYFITAIDKERLSNKFFPINVGDELIAFNDKPTDEAVQEFKKKYFRKATSETDQSEAELFFTSRTGVLGMEIPKGPVTITLKSNPSQKEKSYQLIWTYNPEKIKSGYHLDFPFYDYTQKIRFKDSKYLFAQMSYPLKQMGEISKSIACQSDAEEDNEDSESRSDDESSTDDEFDFPVYEPHPNALGSKKGFLPPLGEVIWKTDDKSPFDAYIYLTPNSQCIGYIRIPHYQFNKKAVDVFASIIKKMQKQTDALVIDQLNNIGGSAFTTYALASMLTNQPLKSPKHRMKLTQADIVEANIFLKEFSKIKNDTQAREVIGRDLTGYPVNYQVAQFCKNYFEFVLSEWNRGARFTEPYFLYGVDHINPHHSANYTKPILLLINGLDFSGGDFFPAILQDNNRAITMGSKTAGAGGYICYASYPNRFGLAIFSYTGSIAERVNAQPIENLGVTPDIPYTLTVDDLQNHFVDYVNAINEVIECVLIQEEQDSAAG